MFNRKFQKEGKTIDLSFIPPCQANLQRHIIHCNYVTSIYERANRLNMCLDSPKDHGWDDNGSLIWRDICFPDDVSELLFEKAPNLEEISDEMESDDGDTESDYDSDV